MILDLYKIKRPKIPARIELVSRAGEFNGLSFKISKESDISKTNLLLTVPSVSFSFDFTRVIFDYSQSKNENDKQLLRSLFGNLPIGTVFTISQGQYLFETDASSADLSGTYSFQKFIGYNIIATPISVTNTNNRITIYENRYFTSVPQIGTSISSKNEYIKYTITNSLLSEKVNSFINFGVYPNDVISIKGTNLNDKRFKVLSVSKNSDGSETVIVENEVVDEILFGIPVVVELVQTGPYIYSNVDETQNQITGSCVLTLADSSTICFNNQTENQCKIRTEERIALSSLWTEGSMCDIGVTRNPETTAVKQARRVIPKVNAGIISVSVNRGLDASTSSVSTSSVSTEAL